MSSLREGPPTEADPTFHAKIMDPNQRYDDTARPATSEPSEVVSNSPADKRTGFSSYIRQPVPPFSPEMERLDTRSSKGIPGKHLQSVVTTSFSVEDATLSPERYHLSIEQRDSTNPPLPWRLSKAEERSPPPPSIVVTTASPKNYVGQPSRSFPISRSFSAATAESYNSLPLKRNYFHHVQSSPSYGGVPPDFIPPKKSKGDPSLRKNEVVLAARPEHDPETRHWYNRSMQWEPHYRDIPRHLDQSHMRSQSFPSPRWADQKHPMSPIDVHHMHAHYGPPAHVMQMSPQGQGYRHSHEGWRRTNWYAHSQLPPNSYWDSRGQNRDDVESRHPVATMHRDMRESFDEEASRGSHGMAYSDRNSIFRNTSAPIASVRSDDKMKLVVEAASFTEGHNDFGSKTKSVSFSQNGSMEKGMLLAMPDDKVSLSETLCLVREVSPVNKPLNAKSSKISSVFFFNSQNIEVFQATQADVDAPAPGRKHAIVVGQVGLRCIHCRHTTKASERVKRAVCYPSSLKRIYRTVIDMKLDHFSQCKYVPASLKQRLDDLKAVHTRSTGTTMQYFIKSAKALGMDDANSGVRLNHQLLPQKVCAPGTSWRQVDTKPSLSFSSISNDKQNGQQVKNESGDNSVSSMEISKRSDSMASAGSFETLGASDSLVTSGQFYDGMVPLALEEDASALSPLRCFLRAQVCAFSATETDIAVRAPTTFSISVGQVGIGCIHCIKQPAKLRSNRAVCFPFSIGRIYQSVADIQRFHLTECKNLPDSVRQEFLSLQNASSKGSKGLATRQYWVASAKKLGLVDTPKGIRFGRDPSKPQSPRSFSLDILAQAAFSVTTTNKKLVVPEDKETIAEFLYLVMEQLQPCRFTEADRNKRRLKDVGCIGVECKHCAGQVDSRKFFWSSVSAVESNFVSVHSHMFECRMVPDSLKERLTELKKLRKEQTAKLMTGSQKAFFRRVWERLHDDESSRSNGTNDIPLHDSQSDDESIQKMEV